MQAAGVRPQDIVVFERYAEEFIDAGYADLVERELPGVRWAASAVRYSDTQVDVTGFDDGRDGERLSVEAQRRVTGYDPDVFTVMGFCGPQHANDERRFRSHLSLIATRLVDKIVTLPVLKDHRSAGVTLALKNLSHGLNNNVSRSHLTDVAYEPDSPFRPMGPNQCNTFIPQAASQTVLRQKATLHILDGLIGAYEGGPKSTNKTWATWRRNSLFFATDPVAMDHVGWEVIDRVRAEYGWAPVGADGPAQPDAGHRPRHRNRAVRRRPAWRNDAVRGGPEHDGGARHGGAEHAQRRNTSSWPASWASASSPRPDRVPQIRLEGVSATPRRRPISFSFPNSDRERIPRNSVSRGSWTRCAKRRFADGVPEQEFGNEGNHPRRRRPCPILAERLRPGRSPQGNRDALASPSAGDGRAAGRPVVPEPAASTAGRGTASGSPAPPPAGRAAPSASPAPTAAGKAARRCSTKPSSSRPASPPCPSPPRPCARRAVSRGRPST